MNITDKKIISELINKYGIKNVQEMVELNKELLLYMNNPGETILNRENSPKLYSENGNSQIFTNSQTSVFYLNDKQLDFSLFKSEHLKTHPLLAEKNELQKYIDTSIKYFSNSKVEISLNQDKNLIYFEDLNGMMRNISLNEYKLIKLLLKNPKIYASAENTIIHAESEKGFAYVLTRGLGKKLTF